MRTQRGHLFLAGLGVSLALLAGWIMPIGVVWAQSTNAVSVNLDIEAQPLGDALTQFAEQSGLQVLLFAEVSEGLKAPRVSGRYAPGEALKALLAGTQLGFEYINEKTVAIRKIGRAVPGGIGWGNPKIDGLRLAQNESDLSDTRTNSEPTDRSGEQATQQDRESDFSGIPEILVTGSKFLNMDIRRTEDDIQPYLIIDRKQIERSGARNIQDLFHSQLGANVNTRTNSLNPTSGNTSSINLRGLGEDETLILVDGRRIAQFNFNSNPQQPDINGIPLAAVERIEVLATTASGIYGGGATGGAINIVLRRDYSGLDVNLTYGNTFDTDAANRRIDLSSGFTLDEGLTSVLIAATYSDEQSLTVRDRDFTQRGREHTLLNNPALFFNATTPPLGATPNILSNSFTSGIRQGLTLDDGTPLNSTFTFIPSGYAGTSDGGIALVQNAGQYNLTLANTAEFSGARRGISNAPEIKSLLLTVRREFSPRLQAFVDLQGSDTHSLYPLNGAAITANISANAPNNPFQQNVLVSVPAVGLDSNAMWTAESRRATAGMIVALGKRWQAEMDFTWSRSRSASITPGGISPGMAIAINDGVLDVMKDVNLNPAIFGSTPLPAVSVSPSDSILKSTTLRIAGPLPWSLPAGDAIISTLIEHRDESLNETVMAFSSGSPRLFPDRNQSVDSAYLEAKVPLVSELNAFPGVKHLDLQVAARHDEYRIRGATASILLTNPQPVERFRNRNSSVDPTIGLSYQPLSDLTFRASYGTGYRPPAMTELAPGAPAPTNLSLRTDPLRGDEPLGTAVARITGGNPDLRPELSESWSAGIIVAPRWMPQLRISADWSRISKSDNIGSLLITSQDGLNLAISQFSERVIRGAPSGRHEVGPIIALDDTRINLSRLQVEAVDLSIDYELDSAWLGALEFTTSATSLIEAKEQATPFTSVVERAGVLSTGFSSGGVRWRANSTINWTYRSWSLGWTAYYFDSYFVNLGHTVDINQGSATVPSQIYHDVFGSYRFEPSPNSGFRVLSDMELHFGVRNVFNKEPPIDVVTSQNDYYSVLGDPRLATYYISVRKSFGLRNK